MKKKMNNQWNIYEKWEKMKMKNAMKMKAIIEILKASNIEAKIYENINESNEENIEVIKWR